VSFVQEQQTSSEDIFQGRDIRRQETVKCKLYTSGYKLLHTQGSSETNYRMYKSAMLVTMQQYVS
jgi:hypothetical protein